MQSMDKIESYINTICDQIRFKKAKELVFEEMKNHIIDQRDYYTGQGLEEDSATIKAIAETGDPVTIGEQFDHIHRPRPQWTMLVSTGIILLIGTFLQMFLTKDYQRPNILFTSIIAALIGIFIMIAVYFFDFSIIGKYSKTVYLLVVISAIAILLSGRSVNGKATIFLGSGYIGLEYIGLVFPIAYSAILYKMRNRGYQGIILCGTAFLILAVVILRIPSLSAFVILAVCSIFLTSIAIYKNWFAVKKCYSYILMIVPAVLIGTIFLISANSYKLQRLVGIFRPDLDPSGRGYQVMVMRSMLNGSKFLGHGNLPVQYSPNSSSLLTNLILNYGWVSFILILVTMIILTYKGFAMCFKQKSYLGLFVSLTVMLIFTMQTAVYITHNLGVLNIAPLSLPLVSNNVSFVINMGLMGLMLSVFRTGNMVFDKKCMIVPHKILNFSDGTLTIRFKE